MTREDAIKEVKTIKDIVNYNTNNGMPTSEEAWKRALELMKEFNITTKEL